MWSLIQQSHMLTHACHHTPAQPHTHTFTCSHTRARTHTDTHDTHRHTSTVLSAKAITLVTFPSSDASGRKRAFHACLLSFPTAKTHPKKPKHKKRRPNPLPIFFLVVPPEMRPDPEKAIGGGGYLEPASRPAASAPGEGVRERRQAAFM